jgi:hypothetical protein
LIAESFGKAFISTVVNVSLGPPVGGIMFAQPLCSCDKNNAAIMLAKNDTE